VAQAPDINPADVDTMFATNVTGLINMTQAILPIFKTRADGGKGDIINIGSIAGREPYQGGSIYCATKAAVRSFTDALRRELIATRIRIIEIDPGQVETEFSVVRFGGDKAKADKVYEGVEPLTPEDIAEVVVFAAGRRENVVIADTLVFPNHQVCCLFSILIACTDCSRLLLLLCTESLLRYVECELTTSRLEQLVQCTENQLRRNYRSKHHKHRADASRHHNHKYTKHESSTCASSPNMMTPIVELKETFTSIKWLLKLIRPWY
jgi:hypothetical protein